MRTNIKETRLAELLGISILLNFVHLDIVFMHVHKKMITIFVIRFIPLVSVNKSKKIHINKKNSCSDTDAYFYFNSINESLNLKYL
jgi:hypothetical protein